jgi:hypothetical protein
MEELYRPLGDVRCRGCSPRSRDHRQGHLQLVDESSYAVHHFPNYCPNYCHHWPHPRRPRIHQPTLLEHNPTLPHPASTQPLPSAVRADHSPTQSNDSCHLGLFHCPHQLPEASQCGSHPPADKTTHSSSYNPRPRTRNLPRPSSGHRTKRRRRPYLLPGRTTLPGTTKTDRLPLTHASQPTFTASTRREGAGS